MTFNPDIHHRHSIRLKDYDYTQAGAYFVTICTWQRECLFGEIADGAMVLNDLGRIAADEWERTPKMRTNVELDVWTIMPNHFHGVIFIHDTTNVGAHCMRPYGDNPVLWGLWLPVLNLRRPNALTHSATIPVTRCGNEIFTNG